VEPGVEREVESRNDEVIDIEPAISGGEAGKVEVLADGEAGPGDSLGGTWSGLTRP
jgi:hypothetical protein